MKAQISLILLLIFLIFSTGCIQVSSQTSMCSGGFVGMNYIQHTYLWGDEGLFTKKYDVSISLGFPQVKNGVSEFEFQQYVNAYCQAPPPVRLYQTIVTPYPTIMTPYPTPMLPYQAPMTTVPTPIPTRDPKTVSGAVNRV